MYQINNFTDNDDIRILDRKGPFTVIEYKRDLSVTPQTAAVAYYCNEMNVRKRQVVCDLSKGNVTTQAGAMHWMAGSCNATTGVKGVGDFFGKALRASVTNESAIKPEYSGSGTLVLEPTYRHLLLVDTAEWGGNVVLDDGLFLACESKLKHKAVMRSNLSSAALGNEGLFNLGSVGGSVRIPSSCSAITASTVSCIISFSDTRSGGRSAVSFGGTSSMGGGGAGSTIGGGAAFSTGADFSADVVSFWAGFAPPEPNSARMSSSEYIWLSS